MDGVQSQPVRSTPPTFSSIADHIYSHWIPCSGFAEYQLKYKEMGSTPPCRFWVGSPGGNLGGYLNDWLIPRDRQPPLGSQPGRFPASSGPASRWPRHRLLL
ncbi:MAG: hypothetical protein Ct9H300mP1_05160 [Planctomycetaceae bacterium]|nr:MAG: hypothetical protein Ct9H300mP1_05160 [Planctomycetaceae bacterium]